ncbi:MAG TPA: hypothetical protein VFS47_10895 [Steroidobacteraceae bacterium]|nr:hypothetical protein [Steroidobacteraceae bacterium]
MLEQQPTSFAKKRQRFDPLNARAANIDSASPVPVARAEHISIESHAEEEIAPNAKRPHRIVRHTYSLKSAIRGCETELKLLDGHFLGVRSVRPDGDIKKYDIDLRFASPKPVRVRHISWTWLVVTAGLILLSCATLVLEVLRFEQPWKQYGFIAACVTLLLSSGTAFLFTRRTTEALEFQSVHGQVTLVNVVGGIGSAKSGKQFFVELIKDINAAKNAKPQARAQFLRDEMREHHRLHALGVLSDDDYEASKARILASHS